MTPSLSGATALQEGMRALEGVARLIVRIPRFPDQDITDLGRPLFRNAQISSLGGYIKCADGEISLNETKEELTAIRDHLTGGFFYE